MIRDTQQVLVKSPFVQKVEDDGRAIIWHSLFGNPRIVSGDVLKLLDAFSSSLRVEDFLTEYDIDDPKVLQGLINSFFLVPPGFDERAFLERLTKEHESAITDGSLLERLELTVTHECNFRCTYCLHFGNLSQSRSEGPQRMSYQTAISAVDNYIRILRRNGRETASIHFGGGEPLLEWVLIDRILQYYRTRYIAEFPCKFAINTNASLVTSEIARKLKEFDFLVASSLDGLGEANDIVRKSKDGRGTITRIAQGLNLLKNEDCTVDIAVTITDGNFPYIDERMIDWALANGMNHIRINPDVINLIRTPMEKIISLLTRLRKFGKEKGVEVTGAWSRPFSNLNSSALNQFPAFCGAVTGRSICVSPNGNIYGCCYSGTQLGTLNQVASLHKPGSEYHQFVLSNVSCSKSRCQGCMIEGQCGGACNVTQEFASASKNRKTDQMCPLYKGMTRELLLQQLAETVS